MTASLFDPVNSIRVSETSILLEIELEMTTSYVLEDHTNVQFLFTDALVRSDLVEQIPNVAIICHEAPHLFGDVLRNHLLGIVMRYLSDLDNQASEHVTDQNFACLCRVLNTFLRQKLKYPSDNVNIVSFTPAGTTNGPKRPDNVGETRPP